MRKQYCNFINEISNLSLTSVSKLIMITPVENKNFWRNYGSAKDIKRNGGFQINRSCLADVAKLAASPEGSRVPEAGKSGQIQSGGCPGVCSKETD